MNIWNVDCGVWRVYYNQFKEGREYVNNDAHPGRPSTSPTTENIETVKKMILNWLLKKLLLMLAYHSALVKQFLRML